MELTEKSVKTKGFKVTEEEKQQIDDLLTAINDNSISQTTKVINALEQFVKSKNRSELLQNVPTSIKHIYEGDKEKLSVALTMIESVYETLLINTNEIIQSTLTKQANEFCEQIKTLEEQNTLLTNLNTENTRKYDEVFNSKEELVKQLKDYQTKQIENDNRLDELKKEYEHKLQQELDVIESLKQTIESKDNLIESIKKQKADSDSSLAKMVKNMEMQTVEIDSIRKEKIQLEKKNNEVENINKELVQENENIKTEYEHKIELLNISHCHEIEKITVKNEYVYSQKIELEKQIVEYKEEVQYYKTENKKMFNEYNKMAQVININENKGNKKTESKK